MSTASEELTRVLKMLLHIDHTYAARADARFHWAVRMVEIVIEEGGRTVYQECIWLGHDWTEAKTRKVRHDLEVMQQNALVQRLEKVA